MGCLVLDVEQVDLEQGHVEQLDGLDQQIELDKHFGGEVRADADVEQVLGPATLVVVHGGDLAAADLAVADPGHRRDVAVDVLAQHRARDVLQVEASVEVDEALKPARDRPQVDAGEQADARLDVELVFLLAAGAGDDLAAPELRHREVEDVEAVQGVERVVRRNRLADAVGVVAEGQVDLRLKGGARAELQQHRADGDGGKRSPTRCAVAEQGQFVAEQGRIAPRQDRLPVVDVLQVLDHLEAGAAGVAGATRGLGRDVSELGGKVGGQCQGGLRPLDLACAETGQVADQDFAAVGPAPDHAGQVAYELRRLEEGHRDLRLAIELETGVDQAERRVLDPNSQGEFHATDRRHHEVDEGLHRADDALDLLGDRQQHVVDERADVQAQLVQADLGRGHLLAVLPVPVHQQVGFELGHALGVGHVEHGQQVDVGVDAEDKTEALAGRLRNQLADRQAATAVALDVDAQHDIGAAGLEAVLGGVAVLVGDGGTEEQQRADR